jgi:hypothetical protein
LAAKQSPSLCWGLLRRAFDAPRNDGLWIYGVGVSSGSIGWTNFNSHSPGFVSFTPEYGVTK